MDDYQLEIDELEEHIYKYKKENPKEYNYYKEQMLTDEDIFEIAIEPYFKYPKGK